MSANDLTELVWVRITASQLKRHGVHADADPVEPFVVFISQHFVEIDFLRDSGAVRISISGPQSKVKAVETFRLISKQSGFGKRSFLICPQTGKTFEDVILYQGKLWSRPKLASLLGPGTTRSLRVSKIKERLGGRDGYKRARGRNRERLEASYEVKTAENRAKRPVLGVDDPVTDVRWADVSMLPTVRRVDPSGARRAFGEPLERIEQGFLFPPRPTTFSRPGPTMAAAAYPHLSHRHLLSAAVNARAGPVAQILTWRGAPEEVLIYHPGTEGVQILAVRICGDVTTDQFISLGNKIDVGVDLYFNCPLSNKTTKTLYLRWGRFGSKRAQRLK